MVSDGREFLQRSRDDLTRGGQVDEQALVDIQIGFVLSAIQGRVQTTRKTPITSSPR